MKPNLLPHFSLFAKVWMGIGLLLPTIYCLFFYNNTPSVPAGEEGERDKYEAIQARFEQEFEMMKDPKLNAVPTERLLAARAYTQSKLTEKDFIPGINWAERGPNNVGGRTRAILVDRRDATNNTVFVGSVSGGIWKTTNFLAAVPTWRAVNNMMGSLAISSLIQDFRNPDIFYAGTGEMVAADGVRGLGIWKSIDGGNTWNQLPSTNTSDFYYIQDLLIDANGNLYAATRTGLKRSSDSGNTWATPITGTIYDLELGSDGSIYAGCYRTIFFSDAAAHGVNVGASGKWNNITPTGYGRFERTEVACAPNNKDRLYFLCEGDGSNDCDYIFRSNTKGTSWTSVTVPTIIDQGENPNFTRGQAWYDLIAAVDPNNADRVYIGGVDALRTTDGGNTWQQITTWSLFAAAGYTNAQKVHADHHQIVFLPGSSSAAIWGTDGGISYSNNLNTSSLPTFVNKNVGYNVTQFYACAMHPTAGSNYFLAGSQDNGTQRFRNTGINNTDEPTGGDGAYCHIDQTNPNVQITSYVYNDYYISINGGTSFRNIEIDDEGRFINPTDYDDAGDRLYAAHAHGSFLRWNNPSIAGNSYTILPLDTSKVKERITNVRVDPVTANRVWLGHHNGIARVNNAHATPQITYFPAPSEMVGAWLSCITVDAKNNDRLLVTYSSYGKKSIWEVTGANGSTLTWTSIEGNVPDMPVRWIEFNPHDHDQAFIATEQGVWSTTNLNGAATDWDPTNANLANVRVDMLQVRNADKTIAAATHGRGLFTAVIPAPVTTVCNAPTLAQITAENPTQTTARLTTTLTDANQYQWRYRVQGTATWTELALSTNATANLSNLAANTTYEFQLRVQCGTIQSDWSATKTFKTLAPAIVCNAPTLAQIDVINVTQTGAGLFTFVSTASQYQWRYRVVGAATWTELAASSASTASLSGLTPNTSYEFQLRVQCTSVQSDWSASKTFKTLAIICNTPSIVQFDTINPTQTTIRFSTTITDANQYQWRYRIIGAATWTELAASTTATANLIDLTANTTYEFQLRVQCSTVQSDWSASKTFKTLPSAIICNAPDITQIDVVNIASTTAQFKTTITDATQYQWRYRVQGAAEWTELAFAVASTADLTNLIPNTDYEFQLRTQCSTVQSDWSVSQSFKTLPLTVTCDAPSDMQIGSLNPTESSIALVCLVTGVNNYGWRYRKQGTSDWIELSNTPMNLTMLSNLEAGTTYEFQVKLQCGTTWSEWSVSKTFTTLPSTVVCNAPAASQIAVANVTQTTADLSTTFADASQYQWRYKVQDAETWTELPFTASSPAILNGLIPETDYEFQLRVQCETVQSDWSASKTFTTLAVADVCNAPKNTQISAINPTPTAVTLMCLVTDVNNYGWRYRKQGASDWIELANTLMNLTALSNLNPATTYEFEVKVQCGSIWSDWSETGIFTTADNSSACTEPVFDKVVASVLKTTSARFNYQVTGLSGYKWRYRKVGEQDWIELGATTTNYVFARNLESAILYEFQVSFKCNATNWSNWSAARSFATIPVNDDPCNAIELTTERFCTYKYYTNVGATITKTPGTPTTCPAGAARNTYDVWFKIVMPYSGVMTVWTDSASMKDGVIAAYYGTKCDSIIEFGCQDEYNAVDEMPAVIISGLAGTVVYIRLWGYNGELGSFGICARLDHFAGIVETPNKTQIPDLNKVYKLPVESFVAITKMDLKTYPNPASDNLNVQYSLPENSTQTQLLLYDVAGKCLKTIELSNRLKGVHTENVDVSNLKTGVYFMELRGTNGMVVRKFIVARN